MLVLCRTRLDSVAAAPSLLHQECTYIGGSFSQNVGLAQRCSPVAGLLAHGGLSLETVQQSIMFSYGQQHVVLFARQQSQTLGQSIKAIKLELNNVVITLIWPGPMLQLKFKMTAYIFDCRAVDVDYLCQESACAFLCEHDNELV